MQGPVSSPTAPADVKAKAQTVAFESLAREPSKYTGTTVMFTGKVIQALDQGGLYGNYRVDVTQGDYGTWKDTIFVEYRRRSDTEPRILEGDIIRLYGAFKGLTSYKSIFGGTITLPRVVASVIEPGDVKGNPRQVPPSSLRPVDVDRRQ